MYGAWPRRLSDYYGSSDSVVTAYGSESELGVVLLGSPVLDFVLTKDTDALQVCAGRAGAFPTPRLAQPGGSNACNAAARPRT
eukprot:SAG11_NODE_95_length_17051_cov_3.557102_10_plen_83_part_00